MDFLTFLLLVLSIIWICTIVLTSISRARKSYKLPPGPYRIPIIGNILHLGPKPHRSLAKLSRKYGPVMSLKLGAITTVVISSPETAKTVLQKHDLTFSNRKVPSTAEHVQHDVFSIGWLPVDNQWRKLRKICKEHLFSVSRLDSGQRLRREKLHKLRDYVRECCKTGRALDIGEAAFTTSLNLMSATLFSADFAGFNSGSSHEMKDVVWGVMKTAGSPNIVDYFPALRWFDPQGMLRETKYYFEKLFATFDGIIDQRLRSTRGGTHDDLVEALLDLNQRDEAELSRNDIKHLLLDLFVAGTDTTSGTVEWAMTELLRNPNKINKVRNEMRNIVKENCQIQEEDMERLPYLQAVVKETFRLHPAAPFLVPHKAGADVEINGYIVPKDAQVLVNVWAIGRDPTVWLDADKFMPERFLSRPIDFRGKDFELIPFGAGRRICPGLPLAYRMVHLMLATLIGEFEWRVEDDAEISMDDKFGLTLQKAIPLKAVPKEL